MVCFVVGRMFLCISFYECGDKVLGVWLCNSSSFVVERFLSCDAGDCDICSCCIHALTFLCFLNECEWNE